MRMEFCLVLGAGSGIGAALARRIARPESRFLLHTGSNREGLEAVAQDCRGAGAEIDLCIGDMGRPEPFVEIGQWLDKVPDGDLVSLVFAAGYARLGTVTDTPVDALEDALQAMPVAFHRIVALAAAKLTPERGRIVCVSSFGPHTTKNHSFAASAPAKSALEAQVRVFAANFAARGITVNAVVPGFIEKEPGTPSSLTPEQWEKVTLGIPMGRIGRREEVASIIEFLLTKDAGYITGQAIHVNGGMTL
jgi:3-oxoacyl-[acyl-carrier protein] reductase